MKIAVLGAGNIGGTLGKKWAAAGHTVMFGVRDPGATKVTRLLADCAGIAGAGSLAAAAEQSEVVLLAVPSRVVDDVISALSPHLDGKIIIDAVNHVGATVMNSLETLRLHAPRATLYRAFNNLGWENFAEPVIADHQVDLFYCGEEGETRIVVERLIDAIGLRPIYVGGLEQAATVDALTRLWFALALQQGHGRHLAFKMLLP